MGAAGPDMQNTAMQENKNKIKNKTKTTYA